MKKEFTTLLNNAHSRFTATWSIYFTLILLTCLLFFNFFLSKFDSWVTLPLLSTIASSRIYDFLWVVMLAGSILALCFRKLRAFFSSIYWFPLGIVFLISYFCVRFFSSRYVYTGFDSFETLAYSDVFAAIVMVFVITFRPRKSAGLTCTTDSELLQVQRMIKSYLDMNTNYALLLNGKRGTGKTFFVKNRLLDQIRSTRRADNQESYYIPICLSLYGLKSIEDIYVQLALILKPHVGVDGVEGGSALAKILVRGLLNISGAGSMNDYLKDFSKPGRKTIKVENFVIIFDDLDRIHKDLTIGELIGFVNSMVEHENNKIIIVADEDAIDPRSEYIAVREKTIGNIVEFPDNFSLAFDEIIEFHFKAVSPGFHEFVSNHKAIILKQFQVGNCASLRTLIYFLNHYQKVYEMMDNTVKKKDRDIEIQRRQREFSLRFTSAVCIEFKNGKLSFTKHNGLSDLENINAKLTDRFTKEMWRKSSSTKKNEKEEVIKMEFPEQFVSEYFLTWEYRFFYSIYDFITGGNELNSDLLHKELKEIADAYYSPSPAEERYNKLSLPIVFDLSNAEYKQFTDEMLEYAVQGQFELKRYLSVFYYAMRYPQIAEYNPEELVQSLIAGLEKNSSAFKHDDSLNYSLRLDPGQEHTVQYRMLMEKLGNVNNRLEVLSEEKQVENLFPLFSSHPQEFYDRCRADYTQKSVFSSWNFERFFTRFKEMMPSEKDSFTDFVALRYKNAGKSSWVEIKFIEELVNNISFKSDVLNFDSIVTDRLRDELYKILQAYHEVDYAKG